MLIEVVNKESWEYILWYIWKTQNSIGQGIQPAHMITFISVFAKILSFSPKIL